MERSKQIGGTSKGSLATKDTVLPPLLPPSPPTSAKTAYYYKKLTHSQNLPTSSLLRTVRTSSEGVGLWRYWATDTHLEENLTRINSCSGSGESCGGWWGLLENLQISTKQWTYTQTEPSHRTIIYKCRMSSLPTTPTSQYLNIKWTLWQQPVLLKQVGHSKSGASLSVLIWSKNLKTSRARL